jgi:6-phosphogluconolactonase/glucosamine-6-phosphate isomerase/deaminase
VVPRDEASRRQQVGEGWFASLADVPASILQEHPRVTVFLDPPAASRLTRELTCER